MRGSLPDAGRSASADSDRLEERYPLALVSSRTHGSDIPVVYR